MGRNVKLKKKIFEICRKDLIAAGLSTADEGSLLCPLCWQETQYAELSLEHAIPGSIGGKDITLTCKRCNNSQGSSLDARLAQFQKTRDAIKGHGSLPVELIVNGNRIAANLGWPGGGMHFDIVGRASDPKHVKLTQADFGAGAVKNFKIVFPHCGHRDELHLAVLRASYLILFMRYGYQYLHHEVVQVVRRKVFDPSIEVPRPGSMVLEFPAMKLPEELPYAMCHIVVNGNASILVIIRIKVDTYSYLAAFMPHPTANPNTFYDTMELCSRELDGKEITLAEGSLFV